MPRSYHKTQTLGHEQDLHKRTRPREPNDMGMSTTATLANVTTITSLWEGTRYETGERPD